MTRQGGWPETGFGQRLKEIREEKGLSQQQLADMAGVHIMTVSKLERGAQEPAWPLVIALADALEVACDTFRGKPGPAPKRQRGRPRKEGRRPKT